MWVERITSVNVSYKKQVEAEIETYPSVLRVKWSTGGMQRGAQWRLNIAPKDFAQIAELMFKLDPEAAARAFTAAAGR